MRFKSESTYIEKGVAPGTQTQKVRQTDKQTERDTHTQRNSKRKT